jgi:ankyrin repeat protein
MTKLPIKKTLPDLSLKKRSFALTALLLTLFGKNAMSTEDPKRAILKSAIDSDNAMNISAAIKAGALVNGPWERNTTPLMYAAATRKVTAVSELIRSGAQVDIKDTEGDSAITMAMSQWDKAPQILGILLKAGANPNTLGPDSDPVISFFLASRNIEGIRFMKAAGANIDIRRRTKRPLIIQAGLANDWDVVWCLLELGARFDYANEPFVMADLFSSTNNPTPRDSPLWTFKERSWKFMTSKGLSLPAIN